MRPSPRAERPLSAASWKRGLRLRIYDHVWSDLQHEVGGFLLGRRDEEGRLHITDAVAAEAADGRTASVTFTQEDWATVHAALERRQTDEQIVGWYHSHPGFGIFLSEFDLFIHRNFFADPGQVAYVVDPHAGREGVFGWRDGDVALLGERDTDRPGERPAPPQPQAETPSAHTGWRPRHYLPAAVVGAALGIGGWLLLGHSSTHRTAPQRRAPAHAKSHHVKPSPTPTARGTGTKTHAGKTSTSTTGAHR